MYNRLHTIPACGRGTDGQTSCDGIVRGMHTRGAVKTDRMTDNTTLVYRQTDGRADGPCHKANVVTFA